MKLTRFITGLPRFVAVRTEGFIFGLCELWTNEDLYWVSNLAFFNSKQKRDKYEAEQKRLAEKIRNKY